MPTKENMMSDSRDDGNYSEVTKLIMQHLYSKFSDASCVQQLKRIENAGHAHSCEIKGNLSICTCGFEEAREYLRLLKRCEE